MVPKLFVIALALILLPGCRPQGAAAGVPPLPPAWTPAAPEVRKPRPAAGSAQIALSATPKASSAEIRAAAISASVTAGHDQGHTAEQANRGARLKQQITITTPGEGSVLANGAQVRGSVAVTPPEKSLVYRVYDAQGNVTGRGPLAVSGEPGQRGTFRGTVQFAAPQQGGAGQLEVLATSLAGGVVVGAGWINVGFGKSLPSTAVKPGSISIDTLPGLNLHRGDKIHGKITRMPFENNLAYRVYDFGGNLVGAGPVTVEGAVGKPGTFTAPIEFAVKQALAGRVVIVATNPADGRVLAEAALNVTLRAGPGPEAPD